MKIIFYFAVAAFIMFPNIAVSDEVIDNKVNILDLYLKARGIDKKRIGVPGKYLKAYSVVYNDFKESKYDIENYIVEFALVKNNALEIYFIPIPNEWEIEHAVGGENSSGEEINYSISLDDFRVIKKWYAR